jgi:hypothetical protein
MRPPPTKPLPSVGLRMRNALTVSLYRRILRNCRALDTTAAARGTDLLPQLTAFTDAALLTSQTRIVVHAALASVATETSSPAPLYRAAVAHFRAPLHMPQGDGIAVMRLTTSWADELAGGVQLKAVSVGRKTPQPARGRFSPPPLRPGGLSPPTSPQLSAASRRLLGSLRIAAGAATTTDVAEEPVEGQSSTAVDGGEQPGSSPAAARIPAFVGGLPFRLEPTMDIQPGCFCVRMPSSLADYSAVEACTSYAVLLTRRLPTGGWEGIDLTTPTNANATARRVFSAVPYYRDVRDSWNAKAEKVVGELPMWHAGDFVTAPTVLHGISSLGQLAGSFLVADGLWMTPLGEVLKQPDAVVAEIAGEALRTGNRLPRVLSGRVVFGPGELEMSTTFATAMITVPEVPPSRHAGLVRMLSTVDPQRVWACALRSLKPSPPSSVAITRGTRGVAFASR